MSRFSLYDFAKFALGSFFQPFSYMVLYPDMGQCKGRCPWDIFYALAQRYAVRKLTLLTSPSYDTYVRIFIAEEEWSGPEGRSDPDP